MVQRVHLCFLFRPMQFRPSQPKCPTERLAAVPTRVALSRRAPYRKKRKKRAKRIKQMHDWRKIYLRRRLANVTVKILRKSNCKRQLVLYLRNFFCSRTFKKIRLWWIVTSSIANKPELISKKS